MLICNVNFCYFLFIKFGVNWKVKTNIFWDWILRSFWLFFVLVFWLFFWLFLVFFFKRKGSNFFWQFDEKKQRISVVKIIHKWLKINRNIDFFDFMVKHKKHDNLWDWDRLKFPKNIGILICNIQKKLLLFQWKILTKIIKFFLKIFEKRKKYF